MGGQLWWAYTLLVVEGVDKGGCWGWSPSQNVGKGPIALGFGGVQRANLGFAVTAKRRFKPYSDDTRYSGFLKFPKLSERVKNATSFWHFNAENLSASGGSVINLRYRLSLRARHVSLT